MRHETPLRVGDLLPWILDREDGPAASDAGNGRGVPDSSGEPSSTTESSVEATSEVSALAGSSPRPDSPSLPISLSPPSAVHSARESGTVEATTFDLTVCALIDEQGQVLEIRVSEISPETRSPHTRLAIAEVIDEEVRRWTFAPPEVYGKRVKAWRRLGLRLDVETGEITAR